MKKEFQHLQKKTVIKAECGHYHPEDECEVILIKVIKGKDCELDQTKILNNFAPKEPIKTTEENPPQPDKPSPEALRRRRSIVPPGIMKAMIPPPELTPLA